MRRRPSNTAGFSLVEALVALAIAAFLAAVLTRFVTGTRANAVGVRQEVAMDILSDSLLERLVSGDIQQGRTDGRSGALRWRIDIAPTAFYARALTIAEVKPVAPPPGQPGVPGVQPGAPGGQPGAPGGQGASLGLSQEFGAPAAKAKPRVTYNPYRVTAVIVAPSGRSYAIDTIRIGQQRTEQSSTAAEQQ